MQYVHFVNELKLMKGKNVIENQFLHQKTYLNTEKRIHMQVSPHNKSKLLSLRKTMYNGRKKQNNAENRLKLLEFELNECKHKMKNIDSFNDQNLPESYRVVVQEIFKASKHENKKTMRYSEDWILKCLLFHIRSASGYNFILKNDNHLFLVQEHYVGI